MRVIAWGGLIVLGAVGLGVIAMNYFSLWLRAGPHHGLGPAWAALLPPALDPGCYLVYFLVMPAARRIRGGGR